MSSNNCHSLSGDEKDEDEEDNNNNDDGDRATVATDGAAAEMPRKKHYRQRAHSNPISDHDICYPRSPDHMDWSQLYGEFAMHRKVEFLDIGCGYGGLLIRLSPLFPDTLILGMEIRIKLSDFVHEKINALRQRNPGEYRNIACVRSNAMKYLPNYFVGGQLQKMFFLYPDPHFKRSKHKWRIVTQNLLAEYAFLLKPEGRLYTITDVKELHEWMVKHLSIHPLFERIIDEVELQNDRVVELLADSTEEGQKVKRMNGDMYPAVFRRIPDPHPIDH